MNTARNYRYQLVFKPPPTLHIWGDGTKAKWYDNQCAWTGCEGKQIIAEIIYDYITGSKGRWSTNRKFVCKDHLEQWLKKHPKAIKFSGKESRFKCQNCKYCQDYNVCFGCYLQSKYTIADLSGQ